MHSLTFIKKYLKVGGCVFKIILPICSVFLFAASSNSFTHTNTDFHKLHSCENFLSKTNQKPSNLIFESCKKSNDAQLAVLRSIYSVSGKDAESIEKYLVKQFSMPKLKFVCCGWETSGGRGSFRYNGHYLAVAMFSDESMMTNRNQWKDIPKFTVEVVLYLEEP